VPQKYFPSHIPYGTPSRRVIGTCDYATLSLVEVGQPPPDHHFHSFTFQSSEHPNVPQKYFPSHIPYGTPYHRVIGTCDYAMLSLVEPLFPTTSHHFHPFTFQSSEHPNVPQKYFRAANPCGTPSRRVIGTCDYAMLSLVEPYPTSHHFQILPELGTPQTTKNIFEPPPAFPLSSVPLLIHAYHSLRCRAQR